MLKGSFVFDTAGIMYICALYMVLMMFPFHFKEKLWYYRLTKIILVFMVSAGVLTNLLDTVYFPYTGCRSTLQVFSEFSDENGGQIAAIILRGTVDNWYIILLFIVMVWLLCKLIKIPAILKYRRTYMYYVVRFCCLALSAVCIVGGIRGGLAHNIRPITMSNAYQYAKTPAQAAAILNTPFCVIRTLGNEGMKVPSYFEEAELESIYSPVISFMLLLACWVYLTRKSSSSALALSSEGGPALTDCFLPLTFAEALAWAAGCFFTSTAGAGAAAGA